MSEEEEKEASPLSLLFLQKKYDSIWDKDSFFFRTELKEKKRK